MAEASAEFNPPDSPRIRFKIICVAGENWGVYGDENFLEPSLTYGEAEREAGAGDGFAAAGWGVAAGVAPFLSPAFSSEAEAPVVELGSAMFSSQARFRSVSALLVVA